jgi:hypothetical protein
MKHLHYNINYPSSGNLAHRESCRLVFEKCPAQNRSSLPTLFSEDSMVFLRVYRKIMGYVPYKIMTIPKIKKKEKTDPILTTEI